MTLMSKKTTVFAIFLLIINLLAAQNDTLIAPSNGKSADGKQAILKSKSHKRDFIASFGVGSRGLFYGDVVDKAGENKQFIKNVNWIPVTFKIEAPLADFYSIGLTINQINYQKIYDAMWKNYSSGKTEIHRFTHIQKRLSFILRNNFYLVKQDGFQFFMGLGVGGAFYNQQHTVSPYAYEYDGSGETDFLRIVALEASIGFRVYPTNKSLGVMVELGLMQSALQVGLSYRFPVKK
jgi:hypothetical protein